jgi:hypothetical protein
MRYYVDTTTGVYGDADDIRIIDRIDEPDVEAIGHALDFYADQGDDVGITMIGSIYGRTLEEWAERSD